MLPVNVQEGASVYHQNGNETTETHYRETKFHPHLTGIVNEVRSHKDIIQNYSTYTVYYEKKKRICVVKLYS